MKPAVERGARPSQACINHSHNLHKIGLFWRWGGLKNEGFMDKEAFTLPSVAYGCLAWRTLQADCGQHAAVAVDQGLEVHAAETLAELQMCRSGNIANP
jgi:hypothetical protein